MKVTRLNVEQLSDALQAARERNEVQETYPFGLFCIHSCTGADGQFLLIDNAGGDCARIDMHA